MAKSLTKFRLGQRVFRVDGSTIFSQEIRGIYIDVYGTVLCTFVPLRHTYDKVASVGRYEISPDQIIPADEIFMSKKELLKHLEKQEVIED